MKMPIDEAKMEKIKIICDFVEKSAKADDLELFGIVWNPKDNNGQMMMNFPLLDDQRVMFLLSVLVANAFVKSQSSEEKIDGLLDVLTKNAKAVAKRMSYPDLPS